MTLTSSRQTERSAGMRRRRARGFALCALLAFGPATGCSILKPDLPAELPALEGFDEPVALLQEPDDEAERLSLDKGVFTGIRVSATEIDPDSDFEEPPGVLIDGIVENSPGAIAGLAIDDLIYEVLKPGASEPSAVVWPADWRELELAAEPGSTWTVRFDRAGSERETELSVVRRVSSAPREETVRIREEEAVGVVLRTATEVEARAAEQPPGAGVVIVGLAPSSPWRRVGLRFEDLILAVNGRRIADPQVLLDAIRNTESGDRLGLEVVRKGALLQVDAPVSERVGGVDRVAFLPFFKHDTQGGIKDTSVLLGLFGWERSEAAWRVTLLWFFDLQGGAEDRLIELSGSEAEGEDEPETPSGDAGDPSEERDPSESRPSETVEPAAEASESGE